MVCTVNLVLTVICNDNDYTTTSALHVLPPHQTLNPLIPIQILVDPPVTTWLGMADGNVPYSSWLLGGMGCGRIWAGAYSHFHLLMAWDFLPEQAYNPAEMEDHPKEGCLVYVKKRERFLVLCWDQACVQRSQRSWSVTGSEGIQMDTGAKPELSAGISC